MTRLVRTACAVLAVALFYAVHAAPAAATPAAAARLEPSRVFSVAGDSLFAFNAPQQASVASALFDIPSSDDSLLAGIPVGLPHARLPVPSVIAHFQAAPSPPVSAAVTLPALSSTLQPPNSSVTAPAQNAAAPNLGVSLSEPAATAAAPSGPVRFGQFQAYTPALQAFTQGSLSAPVLQLRAGAFDAMQQCGTTDQATPCAFASHGSAQQFVASTGMLIRAAGQPVTLQLSGSIEHLTQGPAATFPYVAMDPDPQFDPAKLDAADAPMLSYPGITTMLKHGVGAAVAVPVTPRLTASLQYDLQHYQGESGLTDFSLDARKSTYGGGLTYQLPHTNGAITFSARQYRYQDASAPDFALTQTSADLNFTVKF